MQWLHFLCDVIHTTDGLPVVVWTLVVVTLTSLVSTESTRFCSVDEGQENVWCHCPNASVPFDLNHELRVLSELFLNCTETVDSFQDNCNDTARHYDTLLVVGQCALRTMDSVAPLWFDSVQIDSAAEFEWFDSTPHIDNGSDRSLSKQVFVNSPSRLNSTAVHQLVRLQRSVVQIEVALTRDMSHRLWSHCEHPRSVHNNVQYLTYRPNHYEIERIESHAFDCLPNLQVLRLAHIPIRHIEPEAFSFPEQTSLAVVNLDDCQLTVDKLEPVAFTIHTNRSSVLLMLDNNYLTYMPESLQSFLLTGNVVSLYGNAFDCTNQLRQLLWLLRDKHTFRDQVWGAKCADGQMLFDLKLYDAPRCSFVQDQFTLECRNIHDDPHFDIGQEIIYLQQIADNVQVESFKLVSLVNCSVVERLSGSVFQSVPVSRVELIDLSNLSHIDPDTFINTELHTLTISGSNQLSLSTVLSAVNSQPSLLHLSVSLASGTQQIVPANAFGQRLTQLQSIELLPNSYRVLTIGRNVIARLSSLSYFSLSGISVGEIAADAFAFTVASSDVLRVNLSDCALDETKLRNGPFRQTTQRPLSVDLSSNKITVLDREGFDFVLLNSGHKVDLALNSLQCQFGNIPSTNKHPYYWIYLQRVDLRHRLLNVRCADTGTELFEYIEQHLSSSSWSLATARLHWTVTVTIGWLLLSIGFHLLHTPFAVHY